MTREVLMNDAVKEITGILAETPMCFVATVSLLFGECDFAYCRMMILLIDLAFQDFTKR